MLAPLSAQHHCQLRPGRKHVNSKIGHIQVSGIFKQLSANSNDLKNKFDLLEQKFMCIYIDERLGSQCACNESKTANCKIDWKVAMIGEISPDIGNLLLIPN